MTVEKCVGNLVDRVRKKFDNLGPDLDTDRDFDSWKRRRTSLHVTADIGTGLREQVEQGAEDVTDHLRGVPLSNSEREQGFKLKTKINFNHSDCSGEDTTGVQGRKGGVEEYSL